MLKSVQRLDQRNEIISDIEAQADLLTEETKSFAENAKKLKEQARARNFKYTRYIPCHYLCRSCGSVSVSDSYLN